MRAADVDGSDDASEKMLIVCAFAGEKWSHLTSTEKRLADLKGTASGKMDLGDKDDPSAGLMNIMKSMYESGDSDTKRMIAKAWTEGQQKQQQGGGPGLF